MAGIRYGLHSKMDLILQIEIGSYISLGVHSMNYIPYHLVRSAFTSILFYSVNILLKVNVLLKAYWPVVRKDLLWQYFI